ncbi:hypothetical protein AAEX37_00078 [Oligella sp. MSHR50489EDL]
MSKLAHSVAYYAVMVIAVVASFALVVLLLILIKWSKRTGHELLAEN